MGVLKQLAGRRCLCVYLAVLMMLSFSGCRTVNREGSLAPPAGVDEVISIETAYGALDFPKELNESIQHMEVNEGSATLEVFYMVTAEGEKELYRIHYADDWGGTLIGYLSTDGGEISVSYSVCQYTDEDFTNAEDRELYHSMMDAFSVILNSIYADSRFSETKTVEPVNNSKAKLRYWNVTLPENVRYSETEENGNYAVEFYGEVSGERISLYRISLGGSETGNVLGWYNVEGVRKPVMIQTYVLTAYELWPEEDYAAVCRMMDTINNVILVITQSEQFSAAAE